MKISMSKILDLQELYPKLSSQPLPIGTTYKLTKLFNVVKSEAEFYTTNLDKIISEFGQKDENGNFILTEDQKGVRIDQDKIPEVESRLQELWNIEVELPSITFKLSELEKVELSVQEFNNLLPFIEV